MKKRLGVEMTGLARTVIYCTDASHLCGSEDEAGNDSPLEWLSLTVCVCKLAAGSRWRKIKDLHS